MHSHFQLKDLHIFRLLAVLVLISKIEASPANNAVIILDIADLPQKIITIPARDENEGQIETFDIFTPDPLENPTESRWNLSLALDSVTCRSDEDYVTIKNGSTVLLERWCTNSTFDFSSNNNIVFSGNTHYHIEVYGEWIESEATLIATIYYDTSPGCDCNNNQFCCSQTCPPSANDPTSLPSTIFWASSSDAGIMNSSESQPRCISNSLTCNGYANCGFTCARAQRDEATETCSATSDPCEQEDNDDNCGSGIKIYVYIIATLGGLFGIGFILIFFGVYLYRRNSDWKIKKDTLRPTISVLNLRSQDTEDNISIATEDLSPCYYSVEDTIHRMSIDFEREAKRNSQDNTI